MHPDVQEFVERAGMLWQRDGLPRIAGRIFGFLLVSPDAASLDDIADTLGVSKASVSTDTRLLERMGLVARVSLPGDRRDYYQITPESLERSLDRRMQRVRELEELMDAGIRLPLVSPAVRERLEDHRLAFGHAIDALEHTLEQLRTRHQSETRR